jgi:glycosyltransferase involved in cell wall biosynthesis
LHVTIHSNVTDARQGGGLAYVLAIGAALAADDEVTVVFPAAVDLDLARRLFPAPTERLAFDCRRGPGSWREELLAAIRGNGRVIVQATEVPRLRGLRDLHLLCEFPFQRRLSAGERLRLRLMRSVVANSAYTASWIERRWGRRARVLHPPVFPIPSRAKRPWIAAVGRFTGGGRSKRQLELIELFRRLLDEGLGGWELHLVGTVCDAEYAQRARAAAAGLPVVFHLDAGRGELEEVYGKASIFWHATGAGIDPENEPERAEHFGIATFEAMSAGAVPVVVDRGGQPEILGAEPAGVLWRDFDECLAATRRLCRDDAARQALAERARTRAEAFAFPAFATRARALFAG